MTKNDKGVNVWLVFNEFWEINLWWREKISLFYLCNLFIKEEEKNVKIVVHQTLLSNLRKRHQIRDCTNN